MKAQEVVCGDDWEGWLLPVPIMYSLHELSYLCFDFLEGGGSFTEGTGEGWGQGGYFLMDQ